MCNSAPAAKLAKVDRHYFEKKWYRPREDKMQVQVNLNPYHAAKAIVLEIIRLMGFFVLQHAQYWQEPQWAGALV